MLEEQISKDYIQAMKEKDTLKSSTLSFLRAQLKNVVIDKKEDKLEDSDVIAIIKKQVKQRHDSIDQFEKGGRNDLANKEKQELEILRGYLPAELPASQLKELVEKVIRETGASSMKDMGQVMKTIFPLVKGQADNKVISDLVKEKLA